MKRQTIFRPIPVLTKRMFRAAGVELVPYLHTGRRIELEV